MQVHVGMYHYTVCSLCDLFTFKNKTTEPGFLQAQFVHSSMEDDIKFYILWRLIRLIFINFWNEEIGHLSKLVPPSPGLELPSWRGTAISLCKGHLWGKSEFVLKLCKRHRSTKSGRHSNCCGCCVLTWEMCNFPEFMWKLWHHT